MQNPRPENLLDGSKAKHFIGGFLQLALSCSVFVSVAAEPYQHFLDYLSVYTLALPFGLIGAAVLFLLTVVAAGAAMAIGADSSVRVSIHRVHVQLGPAVLLISSSGAICISILTLFSAFKSGQPGLTIASTWEVNNLAVHAFLASPIAVGTLVILHLVLRRRLFKYAAGLCQNCGYPVNQGEVCSECGTS